MNPLLKIFKWLMKRSMVFYLFLGLLAYGLIDYKKLELGDKMKLTYYERPAAFTDLVDLIENHRPVEENKLKEYSVYYLQYIKTNPHSADAYAMLGFCSYHLKEPERAIAAYKTALKINPDVLWLYYDLGVIYFKLGDYVQAVDYLKKAVVTKPPATFEFIRTSKRIFLPIASQENVRLNDLKRNIKMGYRDSYHLLALSYYHLGDFIEMRNMAERALITNVGHPASFYYYAGLASYYLKDFDKAVGYFEKCIQGRRDHDKAFYYLGLIYQGKGQEDLAQKNFKEAEALREMKGAYPSEEDQIEVRIY